MFEKAIGYIMTDKHNREIFINTTYKKKGFFYTEDVKSKESSFRYSDRSYVYMIMLYFHTFALIALQ